MKETFENKPEDFLENISEELGTISGTCAEIKEAHLNGATVNDVEKVGNDVKTAITEKFGELHDAITEPWGILNNLCNRMDDNTRSNRETVQDAKDRTGLFAPHLRSLSRHVFLAGSTHRAVSHL